MVAAGIATVAVIGGGAAGAFTTVQLARTAAAADRILRILLIDPHPHGPGIAYATQDPQHRVNVPAAGMSALVDDPEHFVRWLRTHVDADFPATGFALRRHYGEYVRQLLAETLEGCRAVRLDLLGTEVTDMEAEGEHWRLQLADGSSRVVDAAVLAIGTGSPSTAWAPPELRASARFIADPWSRADRPTSVRNDHDVVVFVGSGLTMADQAMTWWREGTELHVVSRHGLMPLGHRNGLGPRPRPPELPEGPHTFAQLRRILFAHIREINRQGGDWRLAVDSLRPVTAELWQRLTHAERMAFLDSAARRWNQVRHRVAPSVDSWLQARIDDGTLHSHAATVVGAYETAEEIHVELSTGRTLAASLVVNCTGPSNDLRASTDPLIASLLRTGTVRPHPVGLGLECTPDGRVVSTGPPRPPLWAIGALRQGELWESTAIPEIRVQAVEVANAIVAAL
jgi:uncharacterized NAD(P)/FAD-binding protein YdhS